MSQHVRMHLKPKLRSFPHSQSTNGNSQRQQRLHDFPRKTDFQAGKTAASLVGSGSRIDNLLRLVNDCFFEHFLKDGRAFAQRQG
jgi:hypothetical protein